MTPPPGTLTASEPAVAAPGAATAPARADGVELIGQLEGSGYEHAAFLVRRADGQTLQLTSLLYATLACIDGQRTYEEISACLCEQIDRQILAEDVECLVEEKLRPLGVLRAEDGAAPAKVATANPLLALRLRFVVSNPEVTRRITRPFAQLFRPWVAVPLLVAFAIVSAWLLLDYGLASATHEALYKPGLLLLIFGLTMLSAGFHEFGHAAACRYGGATPGAMGAGLYLVWPAFYTDVTDSYRLGRWGRVRVDIGGLYFNAIFAVGMVGVWWATGWDALLLVIPAQLLQMIRQLLPFVRFDGYHILADITGVPDMFAHIKPTLQSMVPWRRSQPSAKAPLKRWARVVVTAWVLLVVPILAFSLFMMVKVIPRVAATAWDSLGNQSEVLAASWAEGDVAAVAVRILAMFTIALPVASMTYMLARVVHRTARRAWTATKGRPRERALVLLTALAALVALAWFWWPQGQYRPIQPHERGTLLQALSMAPPEPVLLSAAGMEAQPVVVGGSTAYGVPTQGLTELTDATGAPEGATPRLGVVLTPTDPSSGAEEQVIVLPEDAGDDWPFPFNRPRAPRPGDNQALAVNTTDGSTVYDVAFAMVWVTDGAVTDQRNEAYAIASCANCTTVAVAFQVIMVVGQADVIAPENIALAVNYDCVECQTVALAVQLIVSLTDMPSDEARAQLDAVQQQLVDLEAQASTMSLDDLYDRIAEIEAEILTILDADDGASATSTTDEAGVAPVGTTVEDSDSATIANPQEQDAEDTGTGSDTTADESDTSSDGTTADDEEATTAEPEPTEGTQDAEPTEEPSPEAAPEPEPTEEPATSDTTTTDGTATEAP